MTEREEEVLRGLLHNRPLTFPVLVFGMLGGDPNDFTTDEHVRISGWLRALGYEPRLRSRFSHASLMTVWTREDGWGGEALGSRADYEGIPLKPDPELAETRADRTRRRREFYRRLSSLKD